MTTGATRTTRAAVRGGGGGRPPRVSGDERERAILATAESLFRERAFHQVSVDDLARGAGLSRSTFYFYFTSKEQVILTLLDRLVQEQLREEQNSPVALASDPAGVWRAVLGGSYDRWSAHRGVFRAAVAARGTSAEVSAVWTGFLEQFVSRTAAAIEAERSRGAAPPGIPPRDLAVYLVRMNEGMFEAVADDLEPVVAQHRMIDGLVRVWLSAIYGRTAFAP